MGQFSIRGSVAGKNSQPIPYATAAILSAKDSSVVKGIVSNDQGFYEATNLAAGRYLVSFQAVGFRKMWTAVFDVNADAPSKDLGQFTLDENTENLSEVTVKAQRRLVEQKEDRMILNVENSVIAKGNKVEDLLKYAPLVQYSSSGIKVGNKGNVLILVDGRQTSQGSLTNFLQSFSAEDILRIEVLTNPPAKYDAGFGAVIDIITKKSLEKGVNGRASVIYSQGELGRFYPDGSLNFRSGKWNLFTSVSGTADKYMEDQILDRHFPGGSMVNDLVVVYKTKGISSFSGIDFSPNKNHTIGMRFNTGLRNGINVTDMNTIFRSAAVVPDSILHIDKIRHNNTRSYDINFNYTGKLDSLGKELSVNVTQSFFNKSDIQNLTYQRRNESSEPIGGNTGVRIINPGKQNSLIAQADLTLPSKVGKWDIGVKYISVENDNKLTQENKTDAGFLVDSLYSNSGIYQEYSYAGYGNFSNSFRNGWSAQAGLRIEKTSQRLLSSDLNRKYTGLFPSAGMSRSFQNKTSFSISYSRKISRPSLSSLVPFRLLMDPYTVYEGNPLLKPSFTNAIDVYYTVKDLSFFANYAHQRDMISDVMFADEETKVYTQSTGNLKSVNSAYVGFSWSHELAKWWQTNTSLTISGSRTNSPIGNIPGVKLAGWGASVYTTNIFSLSKGYKAELFVSYNSPNRYTIWQYRSLYWATVSLNKSVGKNGSLKISVQDVFRTQITSLNTAYGPVNISSRYYSDTQRVRLSFSYNFGKKTVKGSRNRSLGNEAEKSRMGGS